MKKNCLKKVSCMVLVFALILSFAACGSNENSSGTPGEVTESTGPQGSESETPKEKTKISFWTFHTNKEREFMEALGTEYQKVNPDVEVKYENYPESDYMGSKLTTAFAANSGPDVFVMSPGDFLKYANSGVAMDLTSYFKDDIKKDFLPSSIEAVTVDNKILGIPFEIELLGLYYNKDLLADAGVEAPTTWNELIEAVKTLKGKYTEVAPLLIEPTMGYYQNFTWYPFLWQGGGNVIDSTARKETFEGAAAENALKLWGDLIKAGAPAKLSIPLTNDTSLLGGGQAAMQVCGTWAVAGLETDYPDTNIGLVPLPIPEGGKAATTAGGWKMMVNGKGENADEAAKFAMWAWAEDIDLPLKWCTEVKFAYSPRQSVIDAGKDIYTKGLRKIFTEEIYDSAIGEPRYPAEIVNAVGEALQQVMFNNGDPKEEAKKANDKINEFLKSYDGSL